MEIQKFNTRDDDMSVSMAQAIKQSLKAKSCAENVAYMLTAYLDELKGKDAVVAFGAWQALADSPIYAQHWFFLLGDGTIIDPTATLVTSPPKDYLVFEKIQLDDYLAMLIAEDGDAWLGNQLKVKLGRNFGQAVLDAGILLVG